MLTIQNIGKATLGLGIAAALAFGASEATAKAAAANCWDPDGAGYFGYCTTEPACAATCASRNLDPGGCINDPSQGGTCCVCAI